MTGSEYVYVPVEANAVMHMAEGGSSGEVPGYNVDGAYINWDYELGIINKGWSQVIDMPYSPFANFTVEGIQEIIKNENNLNSIFSQWAVTTDPYEQNQFMNKAYEIYGVYSITHDTTDGCIGEQMV